MLLAISVIVVAGLARARPSAAQPLGSLVQLRRDAYPLYANDGSEEYEPYAVAAVPLHSPVQILQLYSPSSHRSKPRRPIERPSRRPESDLYAYDTAHVDHAYEPYAEQVYGDSDTQPKFSRGRDPYEDEASSVIVYARPNKNGGFSYRKPSATTHPPRLRDQEPVIIRIHKYRVIH